MEELFGSPGVTPKGEAVISQLEGNRKRLFNPTIITDLRTVRVDHSELISDSYEIPEGWTVKVAEEQTVNLGDLITENGEATITAAHTGQVRLEGNKVVVAYEQQESEEYDIPTLPLIIKDNQHVTVGQPLTEGSLNPHTVLKLNGRDACQM